MRPKWVALLIDNVENQDIIIVKEDYNSFHLNFNLLINQYLIIPDANKPHLALQGGLGTSFLQFRTYEGFSEADTFGFNSFLIFGISSGTEQVRVSLRYNKGLGNFLKKAGGDLSAKQNYISLALNYYFNTY